MDRRLTGLAFNKLVYLRWVANVVVSMEVRVVLRVESVRLSWDLHQSCLVVERTVVGLLDWRLVRLVCVCLHICCVWF